MLVRSGLPVDAAVLVEDQRTQRHRADLARGDLREVQPGLTPAVLGDHGAAERRSQGREVADRRVGGQVGRPPEELHLRSVLARVDQRHLGLHLPIREAGEQLHRLAVGEGEQGLRIHGLERRHHVGVHVHPNAGGGQGHALLTEPPVSGFGHPHAAVVGHPLGRPRRHVLPYGLREDPDQSVIPLLPVEPPDAVGHVLDPIEDRTLLLQGIGGGVLELPERERVQRHDLPGLRVGHPVGDRRGQEGAELGRSRGDRRVTHALLRGLGARLRVPRQGIRVPGVEGLDREARGGLRAPPGLLGGRLDLPHPGEGLGPGHRPGEVDDRALVVVGPGLEEADLPVLRLGPRPRPPAPFLAGVRGDPPDRDPGRGVPVHGCVVRVGRNPRGPRGLDGLHGRLLSGNLGVLHGDLGEGLGHEGRGLLRRRRTGGVGLGPAAVPGEVEGQPVLRDIVGPLRRGDHPVGGGLGGPLLDLHHLADGDGVRFALRLPDPRVLAHHNLRRPRIPRVNGCQRLLTMHVMHA